MGAHRGNPETLKETKDPRVRVFELGDTFNWSTGNNQLARQAKYDTLLFLNDDCVVSDRNWLTHMVAHVERPDVGAVGLRLIYPSNGATQHVGVYAGNGIAGHLMKNAPPQWAGYFGSARVTHESTAITGACMAVKRRDFEAVGGFRENMPVNYGDIAFCLEMLHRGQKNICVCTQEMMHAESASRPGAFTAEWATSSQDLNKYYGDFTDPYWNPSLQVLYSPPKWGIAGLNYDMLRWEAPWRGQVLMLNGTDANKIVALAREGYKTITAGTERGRLMFLRPALINAPAIEIGETSLIADIFKALEIAAVIEVEHTPECDVITQCAKALSIECV